MAPRRPLKITTGEEFVCALKPNGKVLCWGEDDYDIVSTAPKFKLHSMEMDSYAEHACGVKLNKKSVISWGSLDDGQGNIPPSLQ